MVSGKTTATSTPYTQWTRILGGSVVVAVVVAEDVVLADTLVVVVVAEDVVLADILVVVVVVAEDVVLADILVVVVVAEDMMVAEGDLEGQSCSVEYIDLGVYIQHILQRIH